MNKYPRENETENKLQFRFAPCEFMPIERFNLSELDRSTPDIPKKRLLFRYGHVNRTSVVSPVCARTTLDRGLSTSPPRIGRRRHPSSREGACGRRISSHTPPIFFVLLLLFAGAFFFAALEEEVARFLLAVVVLDATGRRLGESYALHLRQRRRVDIITVVGVIDRPVPWSWSFWSRYGTTTIPPVILEVDLLPTPRRLALALVVVGVGRFAGTERSRIRNSQSRDHIGES